MSVSISLRRDVAQLGRALRSGRRGRWFESSHPDHLEKSPPSGGFLVVREDVEGLPAPDRLQVSFRAVGSRWRRGACYHHVSISDIYKRVIDLPRIGLPELLIILIAVLVIFGPKNLPKLGAMLGKTVKNLRDGISGKGGSKESSDEPGDEADDGEKE